MRGVILLLVLGLSTAHAEQLPVHPKGTTCTLPDNPNTPGFDPYPSIVYKQARFPSTRKQVDDCNACNITNAELTEMLKEKPMSFDVTSKIVITGAVATIVGIVIGVIVAK